jgi:hypothetical protein
MKTEKISTAVYLVFLSAFIYFFKFELDEPIQNIDFSVIYSVLFSIIISLFFVYSFKFSGLKQLHKQHFIVFPIQKSALFAIVLKSKMKIYLLIFYLSGILLIHLFVKLSLYKLLIMDILHTIQFLFLLITTISLVNNFNYQKALRVSTYLFFFTLFYFQYAQLMHKYIILSFSPFYSSFISLFLLNDLKLLPYIILINIFSIALLILFINRSNRSWI